MSLLQRLDFDLSSDQQQFTVFVAGPFILGVILQFLGCYLWANWWPLLTTLCIMFAAMAHLFFGSGSSNSGLSGGWIDAGKFLVGFASIGTVAIPTVLYHAEKIALGALWMEILAVLCLGFAVVANNYINEQGGGFFTY